jgi:hypothetical protein
MTFCRYGPKIDRRIVSYPRHPLTCGDLARGEAGEFRNIQRAIQDMHRATPYGSGWRCAMQLPDVLRSGVLVLSISSPALGQTTIPPVAKTVNLSGPRFGVTSLSEGVIEKLKTEHSLEVQPLISQFGWQFEKQFYSKSGGLTAVNEWIVLVGGLEQDVVLPSLSWIVGLRTPEGLEFGLGPNVTPAGTALVLAAGVTFRSGVLNVPVNFAVVPSSAGTRVSMLAGFNFRRP